MTPETTHDDGVLTPDELQVPVDDNTVDHLGENRYVVRPNTDSSLGEFELEPLTETEAAIEAERKSGTEPDSESAFERQSEAALETELKSAPESSEANAQRPFAPGLEAADSDAGVEARSKSRASVEAGALERASEPHGVDITLKTDGEIAHHRATSHDVREVFADLLTWYANQLDDELSPTEALQVLLATTDLENRTVGSSRTSP